MLADVPRLAEAAGAEAAGDRLADQAGAADRGGGAGGGRSATPAGGGARVRQRERLAPLCARVVAVDAAAHFSRPGPRLVEGIELLGHLLHPDRVAAAPSRRSIEVDLGRAALAG